MTPKGTHPPSKHILGSTEEKFHASCAGLCVRLRNKRPRDGATSLVLPIHFWRPP